MRGQLEDFIAAGLVRYRLLEGPLHPGKRQQLAVYDDCLLQARNRHAWMGFFDLDEFLIIMDGSPSLPALLARYPGVGALAVNWRLFGSSGHVERPVGGVLQSFTACTPAGYPENAHIKSIVRPQRTLGAAWSPHHFEYAAGYYAVNTNGTRVDGPLSSPPASDALLLHHYALRSRRAAGPHHRTSPTFCDPGCRLRVSHISSVATDCHRSFPSRSPALASPPPIETSSRQEFEEKLAKGNAMGPGQEKHADFWERIESGATERCSYAAPLGAAAQTRLGQAATTGPGGGAARHLRGQ
ncbi:hypothetical protein ABPG77_005039 [Micractinium sp. CCAP 211/92]